MLLDRNQVYVPKEDFDFVLGYIRQHCPKAKVVFHSGIEFMWQDPPEKIKFGDEQNLGF